MRAFERRTVLRVAAVLVAMTCIVLAGSRWLLRPYAVAGTSMEPTLSPGDRVVVALRAYRDRLPQPGDVVLVRLDGGAELVKRVVRVRSGNGPAAAWVWVSGDNPAGSLDSARIGPVAGTRVVGKVVFRYSPASRAGPIR